jgi:hypothetical protein
VFCCCKAENGRIAAAYNEDGFTSVRDSRSPNLNGFIVPNAVDGRCGETFYRNDQEVGILNHSYIGPVIGNDLLISDECNQFEYSRSLLGVSYGKRGPEVSEATLFGQELFRVHDYEVFE